MIVLTATTDNIQAVLAGSATTNQPQCVTSWRDITTTDFTPGRTVINTNNTTDVNIVAAPAASTQRVVDLINIYNKDTVAATVTVKFDANGTEYILWKGTLAAGESVQYVEGHGWQVLSASGIPLAQPGTLTSLGVLRGYVAADVVYNNTATLANVAGMSVDVAASGIYDIEVTVHADIASSASGGLRLDFDGGTSTDTYFIGQWDSSIAAFLGEQEITRITSRSTDFVNGTMLGGAAADAIYKFKGTVEINGAGTFVLRAAQQAADASDTTILRGSSMILTKTN